MVELGITGHQETIVTEANIAMNIGSGKVKVWAETEVIEVDRRRIVFTVKAFDEAGLIEEGTHERFIISLTDFQKKAELKTKKQ